MSFVEKQANYNVVYFVYNTVFLLFFVANKGKRKEKKCWDEAPSYFLHDIALWAAPHKEIASPK
jgi:hypothetical protein